MLGCLPCRVGLAVWRAPRPDPTRCPTCLLLPQIPAVNQMHTGDNLTTVVVSWGGSGGRRLGWGRARASCCTRCSTPRPLPAARAALRARPSCPLQLTQRDLFWPGTSVTITNWLGSCAVPCDEGEACEAPGLCGWRCHCCAAAACAAAAAVNAAGWTLSLRCALPAPVAPLQSRAGRCRLRASRLQGWPGRRWCRRTFTTSAGRIT